jgi:hypothetical protein
VLNARSDIEIEDTRLDDHAPVGKIHFEDAVHADQAYDDTVLDWRRSAAQAGARASRDKRDSFPETDADDGLNLFRGNGQKDRAWQHAKINQAIALIGVKFFGGGDQAAVVDDRAQLLKNPNVHRIQSSAWKKIAPSVDEV